MLGFLYARGVKKGIRNIAMQQMQMPPMSCHVSAISCLGPALLGAVSTSFMPFLPLFPDDRVGDAEVNGQVYRARGYIVEDNKAHHMQPKQKNAHLLSGTDSPARRRLVESFPEMTEQKSVE